METDEIIIKFGHIFTTVSRSILNNYTSIGHVAEKYEIWIANFKLDAQTGHLLQHKQNVHQNQYQVLLHAQTDHLLQHKQNVHQNQQQHKNSFKHVKMDLLYQLTKHVRNQRPLHVQMDQLCQ